MLTNSTTVNMNYRTILERLVQFDTTSHKSNLELIDYIKSYLDSFGVESTLIFNDTKDKSSLYATIGPQDNAGIGLSAHTDVVPVEGQSWDTDPYRLVENDGMLFGRGTCDMKGFLACVLAAVPEFTQGDLNKPIHLLFSYDEEVGCTGVLPMIAKLGNDLVKPKMVIVGEPTEMKIVNAHKGSSAFETTVNGLEAHSSVLHLGVNAISYAAKLIDQLSQIGADLRTRYHDERFCPPYPSVHVGEVRGGTALNIVPKMCRFYWEVRSLPDFDANTVKSALDRYAEDLLVEMHAIYPEAAIETQRKNMVPTFQTSKGDVGDDLISLTMNWAEQNHLHAVSYGTEAGHFEDANCPTVVCGPGNIEQAHKPNEFVKVQQLDRCMDFMKKISAYAKSA